MVGIRGNCLFAVFMAWTAGGNAIAADSTNWLINNPVSMMDWGSQKAERAAQRAADALNRELEAREKQDFDFEFDSHIPEEVKKRTLEDRQKLTPFRAQKYGYRYEAVYAGYDPPHDRIVVGVFVVPHFVYHPGKIDAESCIGIVEDFRKRIVMLSGRSSTPDGVRDVAVSWFAHNGYQSTNMPANFPKDLAEHIAVVVNLDEFVALDSKITCEQPLLGGSIASVVRKTPN